MIIESGTVSEFKECLFQHVPAVRCKVCGSVVMVGTIGPMDSDALVRAAGGRACCIHSMTESWLQATEDLLTQMVNNPPKNHLAQVIKLTRALFSDV